MSRSNTRALGGERGIALIAALLVTMLMSALLVGFTAVVMSDQRYRVIDRTRSQAFYAASAGVEKLTSDLGNLFLTNVAPTAAQLAVLTANGDRPAIENITFTAAMPADTFATSALGKCAAPNAIVQQGANGYTLQFCGAPSGNPTTASVAPIKSGPYEGLVAQQTPYQVDVTARTASGGEVHLVRTLESVAIPVFQFGIFSDVDLSFFAGPNFNFGGRVHTNGNLFLSEGGGATLTLSDKVTAVKEIVRQQLQNGVSIDTAPAHNGTVSMASAPAAFRSLLRTEGSVTAGPTSAVNEPTWHNVSLSTYNSWIRNGRTGAKALNLPLITVGGSNPDLVRRPVGQRERDQPRAPRRATLHEGEPPDPAVGHGRRHHGPAHGHGDGAGAAGRQLADGPAEQRHGVRSRRRGAPADRALAGPDHGHDHHRRGVRRGQDAHDSRWCAGLLQGSGYADGDAGGQRVDAHRLLGHEDADHLHLHGGHARPRGGHGIPGDGVWHGGHGGRQRRGVDADDGELGRGALTLTVSSTVPFAPESFWVGNQLITCTGYTATTLTNCTLAAAVANNSALTTSALSTAGTGTLGGYIKIERGNVDGSWTDVTMEILNYGIGSANLSGAACGDPTPNAILRLERLRDNALATCSYPAGTTHLSTDYWPNVLFDTREGLQRDSAAAGIVLGGVMHYVTLDVTNLAKWFTGAGAVRRRHRASGEDRQHRLHRVLLRSTQQPRRSRVRRRVTTAGRTS